MGEAEPMARSPGAGREGVLGLDCCGEGLKTSLSVLVVLRLIMGRSFPFSGKSFALWPVKDAFDARPEPGPRRGTMPPFTGPFRGLGAGVGSGTRVEEVDAASDTGGDTELDFLSSAGTTPKARSS